MYDARHAVKRDPQNVKAYIRAGGAQMGLQHPEEALKMYRQAVLLEKANAAAQVSIQQTWRQPTANASTALGMPDSLLIA